MAMRHHMGIVNGTAGAAASGAALMSCQLLGGLLLLIAP
jgi:hypothetical protein